MSLDIEIKHERDLAEKSRFKKGDLVGYEGSEQKLLVVGEDDLYVHTFVLGTGDYYGIFKLRKENTDCVVVFDNKTGDKDD